MFLLLHQEEETKLQSLRSPAPEILESPWSTSDSLLKLPLSSVFLFQKKTVTFGGGDGGGVS